jgi:serine/threonine-protein kinase
MEAEISAWPAEMQRGRGAALDKAVVLYHRGIHGYFTDALEPAIGFLRTAGDRLIALDRAQPNDPVTLYTLAWTAYVGYGAASGLPARSADAGHFLDLAVRTSQRLLAVEPKDNALKSFVANVRQMQAQALGAEGNHAVAMGVQREVVALFEAALGKERKGSTLNRLTISRYTLGNIARAAGDRPLACESYRSALDGMKELDRRRELLGFVGKNGAALQSNVELCRGGAPLPRMAVLE